MPERLKTFHHYSLMSVYPSLYLTLTYIERVANGECHILFLRYRDIPEESLVTLQLSGKQICQAQGMNRRPLTTQEYRFLKQWGREKEIEIAV